MSAVSAGPAREESPEESARYALAELCTGSGFVFGDVIAKMILDSGIVVPARELAAREERAQVDNLAAEQMVERLQAEIERLHDIVNSQKAATKGPFSPKRGLGRQANLLLRRVLDAEAKVARVGALHQPCDNPDDGCPENWCHSCDAQFPCLTSRAVANPTTDAPTVHTGCGNAECCAVCSQRPMPYPFMCAGRPDGICQHT